MNEPERSKSDIFRSFDDFMRSSKNPDWKLTIIPNGNWYDYAIGYIQAGGVLTEQINEQNPNLDRSTAIFPIVFCYRHYLELMLKYLLAGANLVTGNDNICRGPDHNLSSLWEQTRKQLDSIPLHDSCKEYHKIGDIIEEFSARDPRSVSFRYPKDKKGMPILMDLCEVNLARLYEIMHDIHESLGVVAEELGWRIRWKQAETDRPSDN